MRAVIDFLLLVAVGLILCSAWFIEPFAVVSGSMSPTLNGPHRAFRCGACGARNVAPAELGAMVGRRTRCARCNADGPLEDELPLLAGDRVLVDHTAFWLRPPERWQVVAFRLPGNAGTTAVKRIVGLPGETVELRDGEVVINGGVVAKPFPLDYENLADGRQWKLADDEYFLLGDNSRLSVDGRHWGTHGVPAEFLVGRPIVVHCPYRQVTWFGRVFHVPDVGAIRYIR